MRVRDQQSLVTAEQLWEMPEKPGVNFELVRGVLVEMPGAGALHGLIMGLIYELLNAFVRQGDLGLVFGDNTSYILARDPDTIRIPDVSFVSWDRVPEQGVPEGYWPFAPDLAVEIVSPHDRAGTIRDRARGYIEAGTKLVLVLWPKSRSATVLTSDGVVRELGPDDELDGGEVLPGFRVRVGELFEVRTRR